MQTLRDVMPFEFEREFNDTRAFKYADTKVLEVYGYGEKDGVQAWPGSHKNVARWVVLDNGYAVGWNENPGRGWSFPVIPISKIEK